MFKKLIRNIVLLTLLAVITTACGGGSSSTSPEENSGNNTSTSGQGGTPGRTDGDVNSNDNGTPSPSTVRPLVYAGIDQYADSNVALTLSGSAQGKNDAQIVHTVWTQRYGPTLDIPTPESLTNILVAPDVTELQRYTFELVATDSYGNINSDTVNLFIRPLYSAARITSNSINENSGEAELRVILSGPQHSPLTLDYETLDGSARAGSDFVYKRGSITFEPGTTEKTLRVSIIDDSVNEVDELFYVRISNAENGSIAQSTGTIIIRRGEDSNPELQPQSIRFMAQGPVDVEIGEGFTNVAVDANEAQHGTGVVSYSSSRPEVAAVDPNTGVVQTFSQGNGIIITAVKEADANFRSAVSSYTLNVVKHSQVLSFEDPGPIDVEVSTSFSNPVVVDPDQSPGTGAVTYASSNENVAVVDPLTGEVDTLTVGSAIITVTKEADTDYETATATYALTVSLPSTGRLEQSISFSGDETRSCQVTKTLTIPLSETGTGTGAITYSSNQPSLASVNASTGKINLLAPGTAIITVTKAGDDTYLPASDSVTLNIERLPQSIEFTDTGPINGYVGSTLTNIIAVGSPGTGLISYSSDSPAVATVDKDTGKVELVSQGSATITAVKAQDNTYAEATASYQLNVSKQTQTVNFTQPSISGSVGDVITNTASGQGSGAITYSTSDLSIARVDTNTGELTLAGAGTATITANIEADTKFEAASATYQVTVGKLVQTLAFDQSGPLNGTVGDVLSNKASGSGSGQVAYVSSDSGVVSVDAQTGEATLLGQGSATITATIEADTQYESATASYVINVGLKSVALSFTDSGPLSGQTGTSLSNPVIVSPSDANTNITITSSDNSVATYNNATKKFDLLTSGSVQITATKAADSVYGSATASFTLSVTTQEQSFEFSNRGPITAGVGETFTNTATGDGTGAVSYNTPDSDIASVDPETGFITPLSAGTAIIYAEKAADPVYSFASTKFTLTVVKVDQTLTFANPAGITGTVGEQYSNPATAPGSGTITYASANTGIATVDNTGKVTLVGGGSTTITASIAADSKYNATSAAYSLTANNDTTPDDFELGSISNATLGGEANSNTVTISGLTATATISITGGEYTINGSGRTSSPGVVSNGNNVTVIVPVGTDPGVTKTAVLTVGTFSDDFIVTSEPADTVPDEFSFTSISDVPANTLQISSAITVTGINVETPIQVTNGEYSLDSNIYTTADGVVNNGDSVWLRLTSSSTAGETVTASLSIGGIEGTFSVTTEANQPPTVTNVKLTDDNGGYALAGDQITATYSYSDPDGDPEGATNIRWRSKGTVIFGQTGLTYTLKSTDVPALITIEVTPVATTGTTQGSTVTAEIATGTPPTVSSGKSATYLDSNMNATVDAGDQIVIPFSSLIRVNGGDESELQMPLSSDSLGTGAVLSPQYTSGNSGVIVTLGEFPSLSTRGEYSESDTSFGSPSGIDVSSSPTPNMIEDYWSKLDAVASTPIDIKAGFVYTGSDLGSSDSHGIVLGDLDNDEDLDIVVANHGGNHVYLNNGNGEFSPTDQELGSYDTEEIKLADVNNDKKLDIITCNISNEGSRIYLNQGLGSFSDSGQTLGDGACRDIAVGDIDHDNDIDLVVANVGTTGSLKTTRVWLNNGSGTFTDSGQQYGTNDSIAVELGDLDGDDYPDLIIGQSRNPTLVLMNHREGGFYTSEPVQLGSFAYDIKIEDMDGDGDRDVVLGLDKEDQIWTNTGGGNLSLTSTVGKSTSPSYTIAVIDLDGDGFKDVLATGASSSYVYMYMNKQNGVFTLSDLTLYSENKGVYGMSTGDIDGDGDEDLVQAAGTYLEKPRGNNVFKHSLAGSYFTITPM
ncbi:hypothetical protein BTA51_11075 [Hahella sp. CCB-MM4]|uniref:FG-GAP-like repeat-containing protein n=1 Tax=Hahella sp. (strain CCB-MM4) TaxID=1926491 RepID=UPI000BD93B6C|nr:FG-GAP-like repeat-containing protein [Hahella sp. CCB-MM4]OZG73540.1 hypothetical protein BTA51_11075 [Hahella sp. CCB-MM4]